MAITLSVMATIVIACLLTAFIHAARQKAKSKTNPPRHVGEPQSQKGRIYSKGATNHSSTPSSGT
jgi:hypothetical protein